MEAEYREKLLKGWKKAVKCALIWAEEEWQLSLIKSDPNVKLKG